MCVSNPGPEAIVVRNLSLKYEMYKLYMYSYLLTAVRNIKIS